MRKNLHKTSHLALALIALMSGILLGTTCVAKAQAPTSTSSTKSQIADATRTKIDKTQVRTAGAMDAPFVDYKGIRIGMDIDQVRRSLDHLKDKGERQDFSYFRIKSLPRSSMTMMEK